MTHTCWTKFKNSGHGFYPLHISSNIHIIRAVGRPENLEGGVGNYRRLSDGIGFIPITSKIF